LAPFPNTFEFGKYQGTSSHSPRNFLKFVNTTAIAYRRNPEALVDSLPICNSSCVYKCQKITSTTKIMPIATLAVAGGSEGESGDKATGVGA